MPAEIEIRQRGNLRHQAVADRQDGIGLHRIHDGYVVHRDADDQSADDVDQGDDDAGDGVALHELHGAVHRAVELTFARQAFTPRAGLLEIDDAGAQIGVDAHLLARHRVQGESGRDFGHALGALGDHDELDQGNDQKDDGADNEIAADDEHAEGSDDLACIRFEQNEAGGGDVERQSVKSRDQQQGWKGRNLDGAGDIDRHHQDGDGHCDVDGQEDVEQEGREGNDHQADHDSDHGDQDQVSETGQNPLEVPT